MLGEFEKHYIRYFIIIFITYLSYKIFINISLRQIVSIININLLFRFEDAVNIKWSV